MIGSKQFLVRLMISLRNCRYRRQGPSLKRMMLGMAILLVVLELTGSYIAFRGNVLQTAAASTAEKLYTVEQLRQANERLVKKIAGHRPAEVYLVVDTAGNRVTLRQGDAIVRDMPASCGSGNVLEDVNSGRRWVFDTPRGQYRIQTKVTKPLWIKPDWAFLEEGKPLPSNAAQRAEPGAMGDYALGIGSGYFIHGTLYKRMLGRNVSHGCVRLGDEDLAYLFHAVQVGTRVFIY